MNFVKFFDHMLIYAFKVFFPKNLLKNVFQFFQAKLITQEIY